MTAKEILDMACSKCCITLEELKSESVASECMEARALYTKLCKDMKMKNSEYISLINRGEDTANFYVKKFKQFEREDASFRKMYKECMEEIKDAK